MIRTIRVFLLLAAFSLGLSPFVPAYAWQAPPAGGASAPAGAEGGGGEQSSGDPLWGYVGTALLCAGALFVICKSARR